jgi:Xaa-Pro aminopeptidase
VTDATGRRLARRLRALRRGMQEKKLDAFLILDRNNTMYFTNFCCSNSVILVGLENAWFLTDFRYLETAEREITGMAVQKMTQNATTELHGLIRQLRPRAVGFEGRIGYQQFEQFRKAAGRAKLVEEGALVADLRAVKDEVEIQQITDNQRLNERILSRVLATVSLRDSEDGIRRRIRHAMIDAGAEEAFDSIIAAGAHSSLPHAHAGSTRVQPGEYLLFDMGVKRNHYHSDMTRTFAVGKATPRHGEIYAIVLEAQQRALDRIRAGASCRDVDAAARDYIAERGYGDYFGHGLGHGVGLEIHEGPTLNPRSNERLKSGQVVTVEPGIYIPGFGGVRIEDLCLVTRTGHVNLTHAAKKFRTLRID